MDQSAHARVHRRDRCERQGDQLAGEGHDALSRATAEQAIFADVRRTLERLGTRFDVYSNEAALYAAGKGEEALAGPPPWQEVGNEVKRLSPEQGPPAEEERIQPSSPPSLVTGHPKEQPVASGAPSEDAPPPQPAGAGMPSPFVPVLLATVMVGFGLLYAYWGGLWESLAGAACFGLPFGFVLGALTVRWARGLARRG